MSKTFRVGDLVILQHASYYEEYEGYFAVVVGAYRPRNGLNMRTMEREVASTYKVRILKSPDCLHSEERTVLVRPHQIRHPPQLDELRDTTRKQEKPKANVAKSEETSKA